ncbi:hypothetical protein Q5W10_09360, partial [Waltera intestinalis]
ESASIVCILDSRQIHYNRDVGTLFFSFIQLTKTLLYTGFRSEDLAAHKSAVIIIIVNAPYQVP